MRTKSDINIPKGVGKPHQTNRTIQFTTSRCRKAFPNSFLIFMQKNACFKTWFIMFGKVWHEHSKGVRKPLRARVFLNYISPHVIVGFIPTIHAVYCKVRKQALYLRPKPSAWIVRTSTQLKFIPISPL